MPSTIGYPQGLTARASRDKREQVSKAQNLLRYASLLRREREDAWVGSERRYMGQIWTSTDDPSADYVSVPLSFSTIETIVPFISGGDVTFMVEPSSGDSDSVRSRYIGVYLNRLWRSHEFDGAPKVRQSTHDFLLYGDGFLEVQFDIVERVKRGPDGKAIPGSGKKMLKLSIEHVSPWDVWIDPNASSLTDARWYVKRVTLPLDVLKEDNRYSNVSNISADPAELDMMDGRLHRTESLSELNKTEDYVSVYDFYDADKRLLISFTQDSDLPLRWIEDVSPMMIHMPNHPIPNSPWHLGEIEQVSALQDELNKTRSQMITHRRRNAPKYMYRDDLLSPEAVDALQSSVVNAGIPVSSDTPFDDVVRVLAPTPLTGEHYQISDMIQSDIYEITGVNEYLRGTVPSQARTATEASIVEGGANIKVRDKLRMVEHAVRQVGQLLLDITAEAIPATDFKEMTQYLTGREAEAVLRASGADVYNESGQPLDAMLQASPGLFVGEYEVFVEKGSTELRDPQFREQKYKEMFMVLSQAFPLLQQAGVQLNLKRVLELWLESAGVTDIDGIFQAPDVQSPDVQAIMQQLQQQAQGQPQGAPQPRSEGLMGKAAQSAGTPNQFGVGPPQAPITDQNSRMLPPQL